MSTKKASASTASHAPALIKLFILPGGATPSAPIGPALGQKGVRAIDFCKQFNEASLRSFASSPPSSPAPLAAAKPNPLDGGVLPLRVHITVNPDRTFSFVMRPPATSALLKRAAGIDKASSSHTVVRLSAKVLFEVAKVKHRDPMMTHLPFKTVFAMVLASARSYGFEVF